MLPLAQAALGAPYPNWIAGDLLAGPATNGTNVMSSSSYAVHHLQDAEKAVAAGCRRRMAPGGCLIWIDVFREAGESRANYLARYETRVGAGATSPTTTPSGPGPHPAL